MYLRVDGGAESELSYDARCWLVEGQVGLVRRHRGELRFKPDLPPTAARPTQRGGMDAEQAVKGAIARRAKPGALPGYVRLVLTLELRQTFAEQLSARAIREGKSLEAVMIDLLEGG